MNTTVKRSIFGVIFLAVMLGGLLFHRVAFAILFSFITLVMLTEFFRMTMGKAYRELRNVTATDGVLLFWLTHTLLFHGEPVWYVIPMALLFILSIMVYSLFIKNHTDFLKTAFLYAGMLYIAFPMALSNIVVYQNGEFSGLLMIAFFCIIWASDVGAYCFGLLLGKKIWTAKLCPTISPNKSWAGYVGGLLTAVLTGAIINWTGLVSIPMVHCLVLAAIMHVMGVFGDLFESMWKRATGIKDSGNIIPGHGGLMDRFDSALFAIPAGYIYLLAVELV